MTATLNVASEIASVPRRVEPEADYVTRPPSAPVIGIAEFRTLLQPHLDDFISAKTHGYEHYSDDPLLRAIWEYPRALVAARGKRIRPYVAYLMYRSLREESEAESEAGALRLLVALELFHLFCMVHDDIIDKGHERHSLPTVQRYVTARLDEEDRLHNHEHIGNAQALLLGDMLFAWSQQAFHRNRDFEEETLREAGRYFDLMIDEVVIGEMIDVDMMTRRRASGAEIHQKMLLKTASYTFIRPLQIGAALAGRSREYESFCAELGLSLGLAFQIQDDLLDLVGTPERIQKTVLSDLRENQHTIFTQYIFDNGSAGEKEKLRAMMGSDLGPEDRARVLDLFESSGALAFGAEAIGRHLNDACRLVNTGPATLRQREALCELIGVISKRAL